jgi:thioredoxin 1
MALEITDGNFQETVLDNGGIVVVDFWAEWCGPCKMIGPIIEELAVEYKGKATIGKVDVDSNSSISFKYGIRAIPTILILKNGEIVDKQVGFTTKVDLAKKIDLALAS